MGVKGEPKVLPLTNVHIPVDCTTLPGNSSHSLLGLEDIETDPETADGEQHPEGVAGELLIGAKMASGFACELLQDAVPGPHYEERIPADRKLFLRLQDFIQKVLRRIAGGVVDLPTVSRVELFGQAADLAQEVLRGIAEGAADDVINARCVGPLDHPGQGILAEVTGPPLQ